MPNSELPPNITHCGRSAQDFLVSNLFLVASVTFPAPYDSRHAPTKTAITKGCMVCAEWRKEFCAVLSQAACTHYLQIFTDQLEFYILVFSHVVFNHAYGSGH